MMSEETARRRSRRLEELGYHLSPQRIQEISAGARPNPDEYQAARLVEVASAIESGVSPEEAAAADYQA